MYFYNTGRRQTVVAARSVGERRALDLKPQPRVCPYHSTLNPINPKPSRAQGGGRQGVAARVYIHIRS